MPPLTTSCGSFRGVSFQVPMKVLGVQRRKSKNRGAPLPARGRREERHNSKLPESKTPTSSLEKNFFERVFMRLLRAAFLLLVLLNGCDLSFGQTSSQRAWDIIQRGHDSHSTKERVNAIRALGQLSGDSRAQELAEESISDKKAEVRAAAAFALGRLGSSRSIPLLKETLKDKNAKVALASSSALLSLGDPSGYLVYREVLLRKRKSGEGAVEDEKRLLQDPKALSLVMVGVAAGFVPYAGYAWEMFEVLPKDYAGPVRVEAAQKLATDQDPETERALVKTASDKVWKVRVAAVDALAQRTDPLLMDTLATHLTDKKQAVRCAAAAGVIRLSDAKESEAWRSSTVP
jgi:HEAT repeat protein